MIIHTPTSDNTLKHRIPMYVFEIPNAYAWVEPMISTQETTSLKLQNALASGFAACLYFSHSIIAAIMLPTSEAISIAHPIMVDCLSTNDWAGSCCCTVIVLFQSLSVFQPHNHTTNEDKKSPKTPFGTGADYAKIGEEISSSNQGQNIMDDKKQLLHNATIAYYAMEEPLMTDSAYDKLFDEIYADTTTPFDLYQSIFKGTGRKRELSQPMLSLRKARTQEDIDKWIKTVKQPVYLSPKYDGIAALIVIKDGAVLSATTRGNGQVGEDITYAISHVPGVENLGDGEHKVEVCMSSAAMRKLNENREESKQYTHPRNAVAGVIRTTNKTVKDSASLLSIHKHFDNKAYGVVHTLLPEEDSAEVMREYYQKILDSMVESDDVVMLDGVVAFAAHSDGLPDETLGNDGSTPYWAIAWKFPNEAKEAHIVDVKWQKGRTKNTPVAYFDPAVDFDGVIVSKASLHNQDNIDRLGVHIGDYVHLIRSNEVIPYVTGLSRKGKVRTPIASEPEVSASTENIIKNIITVLDVKGAGEKTIESLAEYIGQAPEDSFAATYILQEILAIVKGGKDALLKAVPHLGDKSADTLVESFTKSIDRATYTDALASASLDGLGKKMMRNVVKTFSSPDELYTGLKTKSISSPENFGEARLRLLIDNSKALYTHVHTLMDARSEDRNTGEFSANAQPSSRGRGKAVITGKVEGYTRKEIEKILEDAGWVLVGAISASTDVLFNASGKSSSKDKAARSQGIEVVMVGSIEDIEDYIKD